MICKKQSGECGVLGGVKVGIGLEGLRHVAIEVADFTRDCSNELRLVRREVREGLCSFGVLDQLQA